MLTCCERAALFVLNARNGAHLVVAAINTVLYILSVLAGDPIRGESRVLGHK